MRSKYRAASAAPVYALTPAATGECVPVRAQYGVKLLLHQQLLLRFVQQPVAGPQPHRAGVGSEYPVAKAVNGAYADPRWVALDAAVPGGTQEPLLKPVGRIPAEGAEHQLAGQALPGEQEVYGPELDADGLARPGPAMTSSGRPCEQRPLAGRRPARGAGGGWRGRCPWVSSANYGAALPGGTDRARRAQGKRISPAGDAYTSGSRSWPSRPAPAGSTARSACPGAGC